LEDWTRPPDADDALPSILTQSIFHQHQRVAGDEHRQQVRNEKRTCEHTHTHTKSQAGPMRLITQEYYRRFI